MCIRDRLAEINAAQAETDFARTQKLYNDKLISAEEYEKGEVSVKQAREELQTAKDNLESVKEGITKNSASFSSTLIRSTITGPVSYTHLCTAVPWCCYQDCRTRRQEAFYST